MELLNGNSARRRISAVIPALIAGTIAISGMTGCADNRNDAQEQYQPSQSSAQSTNETTSSAQADDMGREEKVEMTGYAQTYAEELAWVKFSDDPDDSQGKYGCIDKDGNVKYVIPKNQKNMQPTPFENGYSYLIPIASYGSEFTIKTIGVLDKNGNVTKLGDEQNVEIVAYGGGYVVLERHESDFNSNGYSYEIYDASGSKVDEKKLDDQVSVVYCGKGVFGFQIDVNDGSPTDFYCSKSGKWVKEPASGQVEFVGDSDVALIADNYFDPDDTGYRMELVFMTDTGDISRYNPPDDLWNIWGAKVSDGKCVLHDFDGNYYVYDLAANTLKQMPDEYAEKINDDYYEDYPACFHEGLCAMIAKGADGNSYLEVFDSDWKLQFDPMKIGGGWDYIYYSDGLLTAEPIVENGDGSFTDHDTVVYDGKGNKIFGTEGYMSPFIDGAFLHVEDDGFGARTQQMGSAPFNTAYVTERVINYLDKSGQPLFDQIDSSKAETLTIDWEN